MLTGRRYRLALTAVQVAHTERAGGICRVVWNVGLEQRREFRRRGRWISYNEQAGELAAAKKEFKWLADAPSHTLQQTLRDLDRACQEHGTFKVRWRSKTRDKPSLRFPDSKQITVERISRRWGRVRLPKFGWVKFRWTRPLGGTIRNATVSRDGAHWYVSFCVDDGMVPAPPNDKPAVGIDRGVVVAVATSDGRLLDREFVRTGEAKRLKRLQQQLSRSQLVHGRTQPSNRRKTVRAKLAELNARIRARRTDFAARTANRLCRDHGLIAVEDLGIKNMTRSAKGTLEQPGKHVRQKAGLNRAILSKGWGVFLLRLQHAARYHGAEIVKVNPAYTSQRCSVCGHVASESRESQAVFRCVACRQHDNADVNAAKNILAAGLAVTGRGDLGITRSMKRQPPKPRNSPENLVTGASRLSRRRRSTARIGF